MLSNRKNWKFFEQEFSEFYSNTDHPAIPVRFMIVSCMILTQLDNIGDETLAESSLLL